MTQILALVGSMLLLTVIVFVLVPIAIYFNAKADKQFTTIPEGEIKAIVVGDTMKCIIPNIRGHHLVGEGLSAEIKEGEEPRQSLPVPKWLKIFGLKTKERTAIVWVGFDYPRTRVLTYFNVWEKLTKKQKGYEIEHREEWVNSLYWRYPYPVEAKDVELVGNFQVDITIVAAIEIVRPYIPFFILKGKWFSPVIAAIQGAIANYGRDLTFDALRDKPKEGKDAGLLKAITDINDILEEKYGVKVIGVDFVSMEPSIGQDEVIKALTAVKIAEQKAKATIEKAEGDKQAILKQFEGESQGFGLLLAKANEYGKEGLAVLQAERISKNFGQNSNMSTLVLGNKQIPVVATVPLGDEKEKKEDKQKPAAS